MYLPLIKRVWALFGHNFCLSTVIDEEANQAYIEKLKQDISSDPQNPVDCSRWE